MSVLPNFTIPQTQTVALVEKSGGTVVIKNDYPVKPQKDLVPGECLVKLEATGESRITKDFFY